MLGDIKNCICEDPCQCMQDSNKPLIIYTLTNTTRKDNVFKTIYIFQLGIKIEYINNNISAIDNFITDIIKSFIKHVITFGVNRPIFNNFGVKVTIVDYSYIYDAEAITAYRSFMEIPLQSREYVFLPNYFNLVSDLIKYTSIINYDITNKRNPVSIPQFTVPQFITMPPIFHPDSKSMFYSPERHDFNIPGIHTPKDYFESMRQRNKPFDCIKEILQLKNEVAELRKILTTLLLNIKNSDPTKTAE